MEDRGSLKRIPSIGCLGMYGSRTNGAIEGKPEASGLPSTPPGFKITLKRLFRRLYSLQIDFAWNSFPFVENP